MVEKLKKYDLVELGAGITMGQYSSMMEVRPNGEFFKVEDVEPILNSLQQLRAKIALAVSSIARDSSIPMADRLDKIVVLVNEQLSAV